MQSCASALASGFLLTTSQPLTPGEFHYYAPDNDFRLPQTANAGDCQITVDLMPGGLAVQGSWMDVWTMANTMITACAATRGLPVWYTGGYVQVGTTRGLRVTMRRAPTAVEGKEVNGTTPEAETA
ncbi:MAG: hypothetical protein Q9188_001965 [Gyalolechia gomerana]